jgi:hypothetical protein
MATEEGLGGATLQAVATVAPAIAGGGRWRT